MAPSLVCCITALTAVVEDVVSVEIKSVAADKYFTRNNDASLFLAMYLYQWPDSNSTKAQNKSNIIINLGRPYSTISM